MKAPGGNFPDAKLFPPLWPRRAKISRVESIFRLGLRNDHALNFGSIARPTGQRDGATSTYLAGASPVKAQRSKEYVRALAGKHSRGAMASSGPMSQPGAFGSGFFVDVTVPSGSPKLILEAESDGGNWEEFYSRKVKGPLFAARYDDVPEQVGNYGSWIRAYDTIYRSDRRQIRAHIKRLKKRPLISIILPVFNTKTEWLERAIESVRNQLYPNWELCIVDDGSTAPHVWPLITRVLRSDARIKARRLNSTMHIAAASNAALELACGDFVAFLDHDDELASTALYFAAVELDRDPTLKLIYSDEDKLDPHGRRCDPHFKTDWNPDLFHGQNFISHLYLHQACPQGRRISRGL